jgi:glyoxylase-like metal-dependent hydrolase (beta-lactamase superfamily II)
MIRTPIWLAAIPALAVVAIAGIEARAGGSLQRAAGQADAAAADLDVLQLRSNFYVIAGAGGNVGVQVGIDGVVVVDAGSTARARDLLTAIRKISPKAIRYVIDTSGDPDHVGGNETISVAGATLFTGWTTGNAGVFGRPGASIVSTEQVLERMTRSAGQTAPYPIDALPTEAFYQPRKYMYLNDEGIEMLHMPAAHTSGDAVVFFRRSDVVMAGDVLDLRHFPVIDIAQGGTVQGEIAALNKLVELAIPSVPIVAREAGTAVVPGHGRVCDQFDVVEYRDMITIIRDRVRDLLAAGKTLEQVQAAAPAKGYTGRYGSTTGPWTTNQFVEAVYRSLAQEKS